MAKSLGLILTALMSKVLCKSRFEFVRSLLQLYPAIKEGRVHPLLRMKRKDSFCSSGDDASRYYTD